MEYNDAKKYFRQRDVVAWYANAANHVGLWESEEKIFERVFNKEEPLLELGCGGGRIVIGMWERGYRKVTAIDYSREMVEAARRMAKLLEYAIDIRYGDATELKFPDESFSGAVFGFNGMMQIPKRENRKKAMREIFRVLKPGSSFVFTTHDRNNRRRIKHWEDEKVLWNKGEQAKELDEFGDIYRDTEFGYMYIHAPSKEEIFEDITDVGFKVNLEQWRSAIANEPQRVRDFSDDCKFWVVSKPGVSITESVTPDHKE